MKAKEQVIFDIKSEKFQYLLRGNNKTRNVVDIDVINKRLNQVKRTNIYTNAKMIIVALSIIAFFVLISVKF
jgi:hypothetical protein